MSLSALAIIKKWEYESTTVQRKNEKSVWDFILIEYEVILLGNKET